METLFLQYVNEWGLLVYAIIFIAMFVEGDIVLFSAFYLANLGHINVWALITVGIVGVVFGDMIWYKIGERLEKRSAFFRKIAAKITKTLDRRLQKHPISTLWITKFTYGIHHAVLLRAGATHIPIKKYFLIMTGAAITWTGVLGGLAYFSSISIDLLGKYIKYGEISLLIGIIIFFIIMRLLSKIGHKEIKEEDENINFN
jgi:membrane protein DedA with SNARE-associated domain